MENITSERRLLDEKLNVFESNRIKEPKLSHQHSIRRIDSTNPIFYHKYEKNYDKYDICWICEGW